MAQKAIGAKGHWTDALLRTLKKNVMHVSVLADKLPSEMHVSGQFLE